MRRLNLPLAYCTGCSAEFAEAELTTTEWGAFCPECLAGYIRELERYYDVYLQLRALGVIDAHPEVMRRAAEGSPTERASAYIASVPEFWGKLQERVAARREKREAGRAAS